MAEAVAAMLGKALADTHAQSIQLTRDEAIMAYAAAEAAVIEMRRGKER